jgi:hypothetical protein
MVGDIAVPMADPIAKVGDNGDIWVWPQGYGNGPSLTFAPSEWEKVRNSVEAARRVARQATPDWSAYLATEGNGTEL